MPRINAHMTLLDVVASFRATEAVFRSRDTEAGECILCCALFETIGEAAARYGLDLQALLADLEAAAGPSPHAPAEPTEDA